jgi:hypothetical protein
MSNTITISDSLSYAAGSVTRYSAPARSFSIATTSEVLNNTVQLVGTTHEVVAAGDATDTCYCVLTNLHATETVQYGVDDSSVFVPVGQINPSDPPVRLGRLASLAGLYLKASAAGVPVSVQLLKIVAPA